MTTPATGANRPEADGDVPALEARALGHSYGPREILGGIDFSIKRGEFVCIVGTYAVGTDGVVTSRCQWPEDLQAQGIPAYGVHTAHWNSINNPRPIELVAAAVRERQPRWDETKVSAARRELLGK